jgi:hypothetical protein
MTNDIKLNPDRFWENGYSLIRGVFKSEEIVSLRKHALESVSHKGDLLSNPFLRTVLLDDKVLAIASRILGGTPVYFGDSTSSIGDKSHGYHKDNVDRNDINGPDWQSRYTILRFGLYLQDHSRHSGGLNLRVKSHLTTRVHEGRNIYLRTKLGDLVVWSLRTSHSGCGRLFRVVRSLQLAPDRADRLPSFLFAPTVGQRIALFWSFGLDDQHLVRDIAYLKTRTYAVANWRNSEYPADVWKAVEGKNLIVRDMRKEIEDEEYLGMNTSHVPLPY